MWLVGVFRTNSYFDVHCVRTLWLWLWFLNALSDTDTRNEMLHKILAIYSSKLAHSRRFVDIKPVELWLVIGQSSGFVLYAISWTSSELVVC